MKSLRRKLAFSGVWLALLCWLRGGGEFRWLFTLAVLVGLGLAAILSCLKETKWL